MDIGVIRSRVPIAGRLENRDYSVDVREVGSGLFQTRFVVRIDRSISSSLAIKVVTVRISATRRAQSTRGAEVARQILIEPLTRECDKRSRRVSE